MRFAAVTSVAVLALSTAALAQAGAMAQDQSANNAIADNTTGPGNATIPSASPADDASGGMDNSSGNAAASPTP